MSVVYQPYISGTSTDSRFRQFLSREVYATLKQANAAMPAFTRECMDMATTTGEPLARIDENHIIALEVVHAETAGE